MLLHYRGDHPSSGCGLLRDHSAQDASTARAAGGSRARCRGPPLCPSLSLSLSLSPLLSLGRGTLGSQEQAGRSGSPGLPTLLSRQGTHTYPQPPRCLKFKVRVLDVPSINICPQGQGDSVTQQETQGANGIQARVRFSVGCCPPGQGQGSQGLPARAGMLFC